MVDLFTPFQIYEAACPVVVWLNSLGLVSDETMAEMVGLMLFLMEHNDTIANRQTYWVELVFILKTVIHALTGA